MELFSVTVSGFRRFQIETTLQTSGKLVSILGPNEAGKSSLLDAIATLGTRDPIPPSDISRGTRPEDVRIIARFYLSAQDAEAAGLPAPCWMSVTKVADGTRTFSFTPPVPTRDITHRSNLLEMATELVHEEVETVLDEAENHLDETLDDIFDPLRSDKETLEPQELEALQSLVNVLTSLVLGEAPPEVNILMATLIDVLEKERAPVPLRRAIDVLVARIPAFQFFDEEHRGLKSSYSIESLRGQIPTALRNLLEVAEFRIEELIAAHDRGDAATIATIEFRASQTLAEKFRAVWRQSGIEARLRVQGDRLEVLILNTDHTFTSIAERSDGLRQFLALQAFSTCNHVDNPVLMIDEAEQRLHYDAQADLVQMLARQSVSPKIIYTTHSAGCLPEDLGNGVRLVVPAGETSRIVNRFWQDGDSGVAPLLIGMGASTMAFFPTRRAVMVEGPVDMLVYPTLMREVLGRESLGFQFVPGLSNVRRTMAQGSLGEQSGVAYLVDGDAGGDRIVALLKRRGGVGPSKIFRARNRDGTALEIEDFIDLDRLLEATNRHIDKRHPGTDYLVRDCLAPLRRIEALEGAFLEATGLKLPKVDIAYELLDIVQQRPGLSLVDPALFECLKEIAVGLTDSLFAKA